VLAFVLGFVPPFVIAVLLYPRILPVYQRAVLAVTNAFLAMLSPAAEVRAVRSGRWEILVDSWHAKRVVTYALQSPNIGLLAFFQVVVLSALLLATPVGVKARLRLLAYGVGLMFILHVACIAGCGYGMALIDDSKSVVFRSLPMILGPFASGLAVVVWGFLTWSYWLGPIEQPAVRPRNRPRPRLERNDVGKNTRSA
jgi:hypothetical protein